MKKLKNKKILIPIISILIIVLFIGISYAFFDADLYHFFQTESGITTNKIVLNFDGTKEINCTNADPGDKFEKTFTVENNSNKETKFNIYMENITNQFTSDLIYRLYLTDSSGNILASLIDENPLPQSNNGKYYIRRGLNISPSAKVYFRMEVEYLYKLEDQSVNEGKSFSGTIGIDSEGADNYVALNGIERLQNLLPIEQWGRKNRNLTSSVPGDGICSNSFTYDDAGNLRYNMTTPCNYVCFNDDCPSPTIKYVLYNSEYGYYSDYDTLSECNNEKDNDEDNKYTKPCELRYVVDGGWRIVGIIDDKIKLVKNNYTNNISYSGETGDIWDDSDVKNYLNNDYYINSISSEYKDYIADGNWYLGNEGISEDLTAKSFYITERGNYSTIKYDSDESDYINVTSDNPWVGKMAMISSSDYGYASSASCYSRKLSEYESQDEYDYYYNGYYDKNVENGCLTTNWISRMDNSEYTYYSFTDKMFLNTEYAMTDDGLYGYIYNQSYEGMFGKYDIYNYLNIHPSLYLNKNVGIVSGDGSFTTPFHLDYDSSDPLKYGEGIELYNNYPIISIIRKNTIISSDEGTVTLKISKMNTTDNVTWTSSDPNVATVNSSGVVTGVSEGTATITASVPGSSDSIDITVYNPRLTISNKINNTLETSGAITLNAVKEYSERNITWTSSNPSVATVNALGVVTGVSEGTATITASIVGASDTIEINVISPYTCTGNDCPICVRGNILHIEQCSGNSTCYYAGYREGGTMNSKYIIYGNKGTTGNAPVAGDIFDCDVNNDGTYDKNSERFYYVSTITNGITTDTNTAVLIAANNFNGANVANNSSFAYAVKADTGLTTTNSNTKGPVTAIKYLPKTNQWQTRLTQTTRNITNNSNAVKVNDFDYGSSAARLLTYQELKAGCPSASNSSYSMLACPWLLEKTYFNSNSYRNGYWLENVYGTSTTYSWYVYYYAYLSYTSVSNSSSYGVRPAIEVPFTDMVY